METPAKKPMISGNTSEGIDRISSLPDEVLHNILSSLSIFDEVVQLSVLSKRWRYVWTTMPYLHFDIDNSCLERLNGKRGDFYMTGKEKFKDFINWVLISQRETKLAKFLLCVSPHGFFATMEILRWIHAATRRNVQQLVLDFSLCEPFELPICLTNCESLQVLKLNLPWNILKLPNHLGFRQLKLLHLEDVTLSGEHFPSCFFSKCHNLKRLILHECGLEAMTLLSIASTSLIYVTIIADYYYADDYDKCELKISCPNLEFLNYEAPMPKDIIIENLFSIEDVSIVVTNIFEDTEIFVHKMIKEVSSTSVLALCNASILGMYKATSKERFSLVSFYKLKTLKLYARVDGDFMQAMILLLKYSPNLEVLQLRSNEVECYGNCEIKISCPSLKVLKYNAPVPKDIVVENLFSIEVVRINLVDRGSIEERGIMLHKMIKEVHHSTSVLKLCMTSISGLYHVARRIRLFPVSFDKLKSLKLEVVIHEESTQVMILLLKYSPNLEVLKLWSDESVDESVNWQLLDLDESIVCLESHLKTIHLTGFKGEENEMKLLRFFLKNARVLEKLMIFWEMDIYKSEEASEEVLNFPRTSSHVVLTFLDAKPERRSPKWYNRYSK